MENLIHCTILNSLGFIYQVCEVKENYEVKLYHSDTLRRLDEERINDQISLKRLNMVFLAIMYC